MQGADREYGQPPEMFLPESMRIFSFRGCLFIWSIISVIAEAKDQHEDWRLEDKANGESCASAEGSCKLNAIHNADDDKYDFDQYDEHVDC